MPLTIALAGRPNVGKSTLFNRLVGRRQAMVDDRPGITRDRRTGPASLFGLDFRVIDTAGWEQGGGELEKAMRRQTEQAVAEADLTLFVLDARAGLTPADRELAAFLRRSGKPVVPAANKCEGQAAMNGLLEMYALGLGAPVSLSAEHGQGLSDLHEMIRAALPNTDGAVSGDGLTGGTPPESAGPEAQPIRLAVMGRPNVGKSTLVNRLLGSERLLTGPEAGVTRESIELDWNWRGRKVTLVDTAGLRRKSRISDRVERMSAADSLHTLRFAEVAALVLDARDMLEKQDLTIARQIVEEGRALVLVVNKWDLVQDSAAALAQLRGRQEISLPQVRDVPVVTLSALRGRGLDKLPQAVLETWQIWNRRIPTARLNAWLPEAVAAHPPPLAAGRRVKLRYITQIKTRPPTFVIFASVPEALPESYLRYLTNGLRDAFGLPGVPLRLYLRRGRNPYAPNG